MAGLDWPMPDCTTLCRRQARITVQIPFRCSGHPLNLLIDGTGIRFRGDGEWLACKHGATRRREWRKVHLAIYTTTGDIRAVEFTSNRQSSTPAVPRARTEIEKLDKRIVAVETGLAVVMI
ncbi:MAG: hypothetical protein CML66_17300 [Rhodobacteraceae bacterium]|nr:hypothetical protein [Paracoccaceae bacterium]